MKYGTIIAVDFDGTLCENVYPWAGKPNTILIDWLNDMKRKYGAKLILWTCRSRKNLRYAVKWCKDHGLEFDAVNKNLKRSIKKFGGDSRKVYADIYIDDKNLSSISLNRLNFILPFNPDDNLFRKILLDAARSAVDI